MSKFVINSANYSETQHIKTKLLKPVLEKYNSTILNKPENNFTSSFDQEMFIPNNNKKYFLFVMNKKDISDVNSKSEYKVLYFFPENPSNLESDFFIEMDFVNNFPKKSYLFEGYLYETNFLITDILAIEQTILSSDYQLRLDIIQELIKVEGIKNINCDLNISVHPVFRFSDENFSQLLNIFKNNFIHKKQLNTVEYVKMSFSTTSKRRETEEVILEVKKMIITKTRYSDVYKVKDLVSGNDDGILYVGTIESSKTLRTLLGTDTELVLECKYNPAFYKWEPIFI
jgi:hypothetical protein